MKNNDDIEKLFHDTFGQFEVQPPDELKSAIDRELFKEKGNKKRIWWFGSVIGLLFLGSSYALIYSTENQLNVTENKISEGKSNAVLASGLAEQPRGYSSETTTIKTKIKDLGPTQEKRSFFVSKKENVPNNQSQSGIEHKKNNTKENRLGNPDEKTENFVAENAIDADRESRNKNETRATLPETKVDDDQTKSNREPVPGNNDLAANTNVVDSLKDPSTKTPTAADTSITLSGEVAATEEAVAPVKRDKLKLPLMITLASGTYFAYSQFNKTDKKPEVLEKNRYQYQVDITYLFPKNKFSLQSGFNFRQSTEQFDFQHLVYDSTFYGYQYNTQEVVESEIYLQYSNRFDTIRFMTTDTTSITNLYASTNRFEKKGVSIRTTAYSIPLLLRYSVPLRQSGLYMDLSAGVSFNFLKYKLLDQQNEFNSQLTYSKNSVNALLKSHLRYQFSKIGVSLNTNFGYDFKPVQLTGTKRNRMLVDVGVGLHYQF